MVYSFAFNAFRISTIVKGTLRSVYNPLHAHNNIGNEIEKTVMTLRSYLTANAIISATPVKCELPLQIGRKLPAPKTPIVV